MPDLVTPDTWRAARLALLEEEKALTRARDALAAKRRALPWVRVDTDYRFDGPDGPATLSDLFEGRGQLIVWHYMFGPDWDEGCQSCALWADGYTGVLPHLHARDTTLAMTAAAPRAKLDAFQARMGWPIPIWSSEDGFNTDFGVTLDGSGEYNYRQSETKGEMPGVSVFVRLPDGGVAHSYSAYSRGLDMMNTAYHQLDLTPKGRDEDDLPWPMAWVKLKDAY